MALKKTAPAAEAKAAEEVKTETKTAAKNTAAKTKSVTKTAKKETAAKKAPAKKAVEDIVIIETKNNGDFNVNEITAACKAHYKSLGHNTPKNLTVYIKPCDRVAYYTVNGKGSDEQKVDL